MQLQFFSHLFIHLPDALLQPNLRPPAKGVQLADIHQLTWCAVGFAQVVLDGAGISDDALHQLRQFEDGNIRRRRRY